MGKKKQVTFLTGKTMLDFAEECKQIEKGKPKPPDQCYVCKRQEGVETLALTFKAGSKGSIERCLPRVPLKIEWVRANSTPDADMLFPLCQECRLLLDLWERRPKRPRQTQKRG